MLSVLWANSLTFLRFVENKSCLLSISCLVFEISSAFDNGTAYHDCKLGQISKIAGLEPLTLGWRDQCSTTVLRRWHHLINVSRVFYHCTARFADLIFYGRFFSSGGSPPKQRPPKRSSPTAATAPRARNSATLRVKLIFNQILA